MKITVEVLRPFTVPVGGWLDGEAVTIATVVSDGVHEIDGGLIDALELEATGKVEPIARDGVLVHWGACCTENH